MANFRKLSDEEIKSYKKTISDDFKRDAYEKVINSDTLKYDKSIDNNRNEAFERIYNESMNIAKRRYAFGLYKKEPFYFISLSEVASILTKEYVFYKNSILSNFEKTKGKTFAEKFENAEKKAYKSRTKAFFEKYGTEKVYSDKKKTLNGYLRDYNSGKISKEDLNNIIADFKSVNPNFDDGTYKVRNFESASSIKSDRFSDNND